MKYTNGKKADATAFPFKSAPLKFAGGLMGGIAKAIGGNSGDGFLDKLRGQNKSITQKVKEKVDETVNIVVNQEAGEGLV